MKIILKKILIKELVKDYEDKKEEGVFGYSGKLDIRPPYQREFIYPDKERNAVINTVQQNFPLNVLYWAVRENGGLEVIDGQQRIVSICQYVQGDYSVDNLAFHNLPDDKQNQILNYELTVYFCSGSESEKLEWFKTINIAGKELTNQELRNAVYSGSWVTDAKRYFSKSGCPAHNIGGDYLKGSSIRQEYLEAAIDWFSEGNIEKYMSAHQQVSKATSLWNYFKDVISWAELNFKNKKIIKGLPWGYFYNEFKEKKFDLKLIESEVKKLILDDDITNKKGIYPFLITGKESYLSLRAFSESQKLKAHEKQKGKCKVCKNLFEISQMQADHIVAWSRGGKTTEENCQMLCIEDHKLMKNK